MSLCLRLLLTNVLVLVSALLCAATVAYRYTSQQFPVRLADLERQYQKSAQSEQKRANQDSLNDILAVFHQGNDLGTLFAIASSLLTVGALSVSLTHAILKPLRKIEQAAQRFSEGDLDVRLSLSHIPELRKLELTLNRVADHLQGVEERRQELIGDLAHEIGTPLTVIRGYLERLNASDEFELTPDIKQQLHEEAERMTRLFADLNVLSRIESGGLPLRLAPFSPYPIIKHVIARFHAQGWFNDCDLELADAENLPQILTDCDRFQQILTNLISNALAYTPQGGVTVQTWAEPEKLWVAVRDTGIGISAEDLPFVFHRFWRSEHSRQLRCDGSGIGLAITERLIKVMGGQIEVESEVGRGTTFRFCLPIVSPNRARTPHHQSTTQHSCQEI